MPARENTQVIVHRLNDHARPVPGRDDRALVVERHDGQEHGGDREGGNEGTPPAAPPRRPRGGRERPPGGQAPLQGQRGRVLGQPPLEHLGQRLLGRLLARAARAALEVGVDLLARGGPEPPAPVVEEMRLHVPTVHSASYLA